MVYMPAKRHRLTPEQRWEVYKKFDKHCAYCGCELKFEQMQIDHVVPINGYSEQGSDSFDNMFPACRSCNHYKRANTLEGWRKQLEAAPNTLMRDDVTYKNAVKFGLVTPTPHPVVFYFEQFNEDEYL
jgi:5-methylcytosine-specific restriction endonuclease McrA